MVDFRSPLVTEDFMSQTATSLQRILLCILPDYYNGTLDFPLWSKNLYYFLSLVCVSGRLRLGGVPRLLADGTIFQWPPSRVFPSYSRPLSSLCNYSPPLVPLWWTEMTTFTLLGALAVPECRESDSCTGILHLPSVTNNGSRTIYRGTVTAWRIALPDARPAGRFRKSVQYCFGENRHPFVLWTCLP